MGLHTILSIPNRTIPKYIFNQPENTSKSTTLLRGGEIIIIIYTAYAPCIIFNNSS